MKEFDGGGGDEPTAWPITCCLVRRLELARLERRFGAVRELSWAESRRARPSLLVELFSPALCWCLVPRSDFGVEVGGVAVADCLASLFARCFFAVSTHSSHLVLLSAIARVSILLFQKVDLLNTT